MTKNLISIFFSWVGETVIRPKPELDLRTQKVIKV